MLPWRSSKKLILPSKGTAVKVRASELDKKYVPLLLKLAFDSRSLLIIGLVRILTSVEMQRIIVKPPTVITFEQSIASITPELFGLS